MQGTDIRCPECGTMNKSLFLEETEGTYECACCGYCGTVEGYRRIWLRSASQKVHPAGSARKEERLTPLPV